MWSRIGRSVTGHEFPPSADGAVRPAYRSVGNPNEWKDRRETGGPGNGFAAMRSASGCRGRNGGSQDRDPDSSRKCQTVKLVSAGLREAGAPAELAGSQDLGLFGRARASSVSVVRFRAGRPACHRAWFPVHGQAVHGHRSGGCRRCPRRRALGWRDRGGSLGLRWEFGGIGADPRCGRSRMGRLTITYISFNAELFPEPSDGLVELRTVLVGVVLTGDRRRRLAQVMLRKPPVRRLL